MAHIKGFSFKFPWGTYTDDFDDDLHGTASGDFIEGLGGDDNIWGGMGDDEIYGGAGDDVIKPNDADVDIVADWGFVQGLRRAGHRYALLRQYDAHGLSERRRGHGLH